LEDAGAKSEITKENQVTTKVENEPKKLHDTSFKNDPMIK
jgi:hypothetical protein